MGAAISVTANASDLGTADVVVHDEGPGIDARTESRVFDRFYTGDEVTGTGLGLAIARELALRMNGSLDLARSQRGTSFRLALPAAGGARVSGADATGAGA